MPTLDQDCEHTDASPYGCPNPDCTTIFFDCNNCGVTISVQILGPCCLPCQNHIKTMGEDRE